MNTEMDFEDGDELDGLDLSVLNKDNFSATPGLGLKMGKTIESIDSIGKDKTIETKSTEVEEEEEEETEEEETEEEEKPTKPLKKTKKQSAEIEEEEEEEDESPVNTEGDQSALRIWANLQREKGLIDFEDDEYEDNEEFLLTKVQEKIDKSIDEGIEEYKNSLTPEGKEILEAIESGMPLDSLIERNSEIANYENIKERDILENESLQKTLIRNLYTLKGYSKELVDKKLQRFEDSGLLADEALDAKEELLEYSKHKKEEEKNMQIKQQKERVEKFENWKKETKTFLDTNSELVPGFKVSPKQKEIIYKGLTEFDKDGKNAFQKAIDNDPHFNMKVAYMALALNWDFSSFDKQAATKVARGLKDSLRDQDKMAGGVGSMQHTKSNIDLGIMKKALKQQRGL